MNSFDLKERIGEVVRYKTAERQLDQLKREGITKYKMIKVIGGYRVVCKTK